MKVGDFVKPVKVTNQHGYVIGRKYVITLQYANGGAAAGQPVYWQLRDTTNGVQGQNYIMEADLALFSLNKKEIEDKVRDIENELHRSKKMLEYLAEQNKEEVDSVDFFAWYIVKLMESDDPQKADKVSKMLNTVTNNIDLEKMITR